MSSSKLNIIIDGHNHFHKSLYATGNYSKGRMLGSQKDKNMYMRKIAMDLAFLIRFFKTPDRIVFTVDDHSWRKFVSILENDGYKANRTKDENAVDWDAFAEVNQDFFDILDKRNFVTSKIKGCEGDDLMYFWAKKLYEQGENVIIFSGDGDISQLVEYNDKNFICVFNTKSTLRQVIAAEGFNDWLDKKINEHKDIVDIFMDSEFIPSSYEIVKKVILETHIIEVNAKDILFEKIICGDSGDNVPSILTWQTEQKNKKIINNKLSPKKAEIIKEKILEKEKSIDINNLSKYSQIIIDSIKELYKKNIEKGLIKKEYLDIDLISEKLKRNTKLVKLDHNTIPINIQNLFDEHYIKFKNYGSPNLNKMDMQSILEGSKYSEKISIKSDIFSDASPDNIKKDKPSKSLF